MKQFETVKLFYDTYLYKVSITNTLATIFREKKLSEARKTLDEYQTQLENTGQIVENRGRLGRVISIPTLTHAQALYSEFSLQKQNSYKLRIEQPYIVVYSNDLYWIEHLEKNVDFVTEVWKPKDSTSINLLEPNIIINEGPITFEYKVTVGNDVDPSFARWAKNNYDKVKVGKKFLNLVETSSYVNGMYFYARDAKILQFINIIIGGAIRRVDKIINKTHIDK